MPKIHPNVGTGRSDDDLGKSSSSSSSSSDERKEKEEEEKVFTVWRKSLLFNGNGFTVFDSKGNLAFRVDNYGDGFWRRSGQVLLMDAVGMPLLTIRRKKLITLEEQWLIYQGEDNTNPKYQVIKHQNICKNNKTVAHITHCSNHEEGDIGGGRRRRRRKRWAYQIEGSYGHRSCTLQDERRQQVAEINRKVDFGNDVFRLVVRPEFDAAAAMAVVMVLEEMFGSRKR